MSLSVGQYGASGMSQILSDGIQQIRDQQQLNSWQATQGTISSSIAGLGDNRGATLALSPKLAQLADYQTNMSSVQSRLSISSKAIEQVTNIAQSFSSQMLGLQSTLGSKAQPLNATISNANSSLSTIGNILNTSDGMGYIFSGTAENEPTVPSPNQLSDSPLAKSISKIVSGLSGNNVDDIFKQATAAAADNNASMSVFSPSISTSAENATAMRRQVVTGPTSASTSANGVVATEGGQASDTSTGSPIRDMMRDMMIVSSMKGMSSTTPGFTELAKKLQASFTDSSSRLIDMNTSIGVEQNNIKSQQKTFTSVQTSLQTQMSTNVDADMAVVATQASDLSTRLKASYSLIAKTKGMTLADYM